MSMPIGPGGLPNQGSNKTFAEMTPEEQGEVGARAMMNLMQSCPGKTVFAGVTGFALGGVFGLFMASMAYDTPIGSNASKISELPLKQQLKVGFLDMGKRSWSSAKNFGVLGGMYTAFECSVESLRAKNDLWNGVWAGCATGGALAVKSGPHAAALGCAGFAAFSTAIELYMRKDSNSPPPNDYDE